MARSARRSVICAPRLELGIGTSTQAAIEDLEIRFTAAIGQIRIGTMQWTVLIVSAAYGDLAAVDRL